MLSRTTLLLMILPLAGCHGGWWGNLLVLGVTVGIFVATLTLGRTASPGSASSQSSRS